MPFTFSINNARGRKILAASAMAGNIFRRSANPLCFPPRENGWHGGPPARRSKSPRTCEKSNCCTSHWCKDHPATGGTPRRWFSRMVSQQFWSHSTTAAWENPASATPRARPPAPANNSIAVMAEAPQEGLNSCCQFVHVAQFTLPNDQECPTRRDKFFLIGEIPLAVGSQFRFPEAQAGLWHPALRAPFMAVPEAPVHKDDLAARGKDQVRPSWNRCRVKAIAITEGMHKAADAHFRLRVLVSHTAHALTALGWRECIH